MVLLFLIRMVQEHIHRSIVLIDELELHQHPLWQRKLLQALPKMGDGNQFVVTTHSDYVRDIQPAEGRVVLGSLGD
jgi:predicted ATP-binding protein involved in virulence